VRFVEVLAELVLLGETGKGTEPSVG
jgi:hypothetical protein